MFIRILLSLILLLMSPIIIISNLVIISTWFRFKRLRTPSNFLIISLSSADLGFGLVMPAAVAVDLTFNQHHDHHKKYVNTMDKNKYYSNNDLITTTMTTTTTTTGNFSSDNNTPYFTKTTTELNPYFAGASSSIINSTDHHVNLSSSIQIDQGYQQECNDTLCMTHFVILLIFCSTAILSMTAIAMDRFMSVAQPLRYNHFVTMSHVQKFVILYWIYCIILSVCIPYFITSYKFNTESHIVLLTFCIYIPCASITTLCYTYIYIIARSHARAIYSVEISLNNCGVIEVNDTSSAAHPRYGLTLAFIVGAFLISWSPIQICAMIDVFAQSDILYQYNWRILASAPIVINCAINPWLYAYRSSEMRLAVLRTVDTIMTKITGHPPKIPVFIQDKCDLTSCASNIRLLGISPTQTTNQCSAEGNNGANSTIVNNATETNQNHLHLFLCDYQVSTL